MLKRWPTWNATRITSLLRCIRLAWMSCGKRSGPRRELAPGLQGLQVACGFAIDGEPSSHLASARLVYMLACEVHSGKGLQQRSHSLMPCTQAASRAAAPGTGPSVGVEPTCITNSASCAARTQAMNEVPVRRLAKVSPKNAVQPIQHRSPCTVKTTLLLQIATRSSWRAGMAPAALAAASGPTHRRGVWLFCAPGGTAVQAQWR